MAFSAKQQGKNSQYVSFVSTRPRRTSQAGRTYRGHSYTIHCAWCLSDLRTFFSPSHFADGETEAPGQSPGWDGQWGAPGLGSLPCLSVDLGREPSDLREPGCWPDTAGCQPQKWVSFRGAGGGPTRSPRDLPGGPPGSSCQPEPPLPCTRGKAGVVSNRPG